MYFQKEKEAFDSYHGNAMHGDTNEGTWNDDNFETCHLPKAGTPNKTNKNNDQTMDGYGLVGEPVI